MLKQIRLFAMAGMLLTAFQLGIVLWVIFMEGWTFWMLPGLAMFGVQGWIYWRLWHLRRWAAIAGIIVAAWFSLSMLPYPPVMLALLCITAYIGFLIWLAWPRLSSEI
ncbi:MAG: hypothetical protein QM758_01480 [Armatimonas sp.]